MLHAKNPPGGKGGPSPATGPKLLIGVLLLLALALGITACGGSSSSSSSSSTTAESSEPGQRPRISRSPPTTPTLARALARAIRRNGGQVIPRECPIFGRRCKEFEQTLGPALTGFAVEEALRLLQERDLLHWPANLNNPQAEADALVQALTPHYGRWLAKNPAAEDVGKICQETTRHLATLRGR